VQGYTNRAQGIHASVPHELRRGGDPGLDKADARKAPTVKELCGRFMDDHSKPHNKPRTQAGYQYQIDTFVIPAFGTKKVHEVTCNDITALMKRMEKSPTQANRVRSRRSRFAFSMRWCGSTACRWPPCRVWREARANAGMSARGRASTGEASCSPVGATRCLMTAWASRWCRGSRWSNSGYRAAACRDGARRRGVLGDWTFSWAGHYLVRGRAQRHRSTRSSDMPAHRLPVAFAAVSVFKEPARTPASS